MIEINIKLMNWLCLFYGVNKYFFGFWLIKGLDMHI